MAENQEKNIKPLMREEDTDDNETIYSLDTLFRKLGGCGRFQIVFAALGYFPLLPAVWSLLFMVFGNYNPGLECGDVSVVNDIALPGTAGNTTQTTQSSRRNITDDRALLCTCDWFKSHNNWTFSKAASTVVTEWGLVCDDSWKSSTIISVQMVGVLLGSCAGGQIGDKFGRKFNVHGGAVVLAVTNVIAIFSTSWVMYAVLRFFIGFAAGCMLSSIVVYNMEYVPPFWRACIMTFPVWSFSTVCLALCAMVLKDWRQIHIATALLAFLAFLPVFWLPESLRYLTVHGHLKKANKVVKKIAKLNRKPLPDTSIMTTIAEREKESLKERSSYTYLDLFHRSIRKYTIVLGVMWFIFAISNNTVAYGLGAFKGDFFVTFLIFCALPIPTRLFILVITSRFGRKTAVMSCLCISCVCSFLVVGIQLVAPTDTKGITTTVLVLVSNMFVEAAWGASVALIAELFPTDVRNMAYAFANCLARIGGMISPYFIANQWLPMWGLFLLVGILLLVSFVSVLTLPESKDRPLQENLEVKATTGKTSTGTSHV